MLTFDTVVVGAGITGLASAYHIKRENPDMNVAVVEKKGGTFAQGNTARSAAGFRDLFSSEVNRKLTSSSISFYRKVQESGFNLGMKFNGYLFLAGRKFVECDVVQGFIREGGRARVVEEDEIREAGFNTRPSSEEKALLSVPDIDAGLLGRNCGIIEPDRLAAYYEGECRRMGGVEFLYNTEVRPLRLKPVEPLNYPGEPFLWQSVHVDTLDTSRGGTVRAEQYVLCTDMWTTALLDPTGIDSHTRPKKRQVFQVSGSEISSLVRHPPMVEGEDVLPPFTILPAHGIIMRPEPKSGSVWFSVADDYGRPYSFEEDPPAGTRVLREEHSASCECLHTGCLKVQGDVDVGWPLRLQHH
ncbi:FAD-binding oxidoreductase [Thermogymnomonas acidicola]|uniref:NAD(P)/FAD-dependent oxidoreductase n=1 Tax=Thermogymnomonas acidicola TaxID=399579 RepID=UPI00139699F5|nr:FAD-binding oxidoreductase [Thermogymnomonas acidicola]